MTPWHSTHPRSSALGSSGCVPSSSFRRHVRHFSTVTRFPQAQTSTIPRDTQSTHSHHIHTYVLHTKPFRAPFVRALFAASLRYSGVPYRASEIRASHTCMQDLRFRRSVSRRTIPSSPAQSAPISAAVGRGRRGSLGEAVRIAGADQSIHVAHGGGQTMGWRMHLDKRINR